MKLVIAEKPSVARSIAAVLDCREQCDGYIAGGGYIISWCYGHLAELADAGVYKESYAKWNRKDLPILPENFQFAIRPDKREQFIRRVQF